MKKLPLSLSVLIFSSALLYGGGIITNTNQSASWVRMPARTGVIGLDGVYYNPAGLTLLPSNGIFISLNNQVIGQKRTITSTYPLLNDSKFTGDVSAPIFPGIYAGYKMEKLTFSIGFMPMGGGGGATYNKGVPSFEYPLTDLVPGLNPLQSPTGVTAYRSNIYFKGTSVFFGYQLNLSYKINDMLSIAIGGRYIMAKETYSGYLKDIEVFNYNNTGTWERADLIMTEISNLAATNGTGLQNAIDAGLVQANDPASASVVAGLALLGINAAGYTNAQAVLAFEGASAQFTAKATVLGDQEADAKKVGSGFTPIISVDIHPSEKLNIGLKYEHKTKLELKNETTKDIITGFTPTGTPITEFPDGVKARLDIPGTISLGVAYKTFDKLLVTADMYYYLEKNANWNGRQDSLDANSLELAIGLEYSLTDKFLISGGFLYTKPGTTPSYQTDLSFDVQSNTIGLGGAYKINDMVEINLAGAYTIYQDGSKDLKRNSILYKETYDKSTWIIAAGVNLFFNK